jgi:hypothetical protein
MTYPSPTSVNASKGFGEVTNYLDVVTGHWFGNMLLISIYVIILIGVYKAKDDFAGALAIAGFGTFLIGLLFWLGGMISGVMFGVVIAIAIVGAMVLWGSKN